jgi:DNA polymerase-4
MTQALAGERKIIHIDMDAFYTSIEQRDDPRLRGVPIVVGGNPNGRGVVAAASYEARVFGIRSAMSCKVAKQRCPNLIFIKPNFQKYQEVSEQIHGIFSRFTDLVEPIALDEAYLDVTANRTQEKSARSLALQIKQEIFNTTGLTASAGVGPNKFIAKIASDLKKPNGLVVIPQARVLGFLESLPVQKLWGVGPATSKVLSLMGIRTAGDLRLHDRSSLERRLGKTGVFLYDLAWGRDARPVDPPGDPKSVGAETTLTHDTSSAPALLETLQDLSKEVSSSLSGQGKFARTLVVKIRFSDFRTITRSRTMERGIRTPEQISTLASALLFANVTRRSLPIRLLGVSASNLSPFEDAPQLAWDF